MNTTKADVTVLMTQIRNMISDEKLKSMKEINDVCRSKMYDLEMWEYEWLHGDMLSYYIIHCEATGKVPVSGYAGGDNDLTTDEMVKVLIDRIASVIMRRKDNE